MRRQLKTEGRGWWETQDTSNCMTVTKLADYERHLTAAKEKMQLVVCLFFAPWCMACGLQPFDLLSGLLLLKQPRG